MTIRSALTQRAHRFRSLVLLGGLLSVAAGAQAAVSITAPIGASVYGSSATAVFMGGSDGNVWMETDYPEATFNWVNLGQLASGVDVSFGVGVTSPGGIPAAYSVGTDGNLYITHLVGSTWSSQKIGNPGVTFVSAVGVTSNTSNQPFVFVQSSDGNVWLAHNAGSWTWTNISKPSGVTLSKTIGVSNVPSSYPQIWMISSTGVVYHASWNGSSYPWSNASAVPSAPAGVTAVAGIGTYSTTVSAGFFIASDNNIYYIQTSGSSYTWTKLATVSGPGWTSLGLDPTSHFIYVNTGADDPWVFEPTTSAGHSAWVELGCVGTSEPNSCIAKGIGATYQPNTAVIYAIGTDGNLYSFFAGASGWTNYYTPGTALR